MRWVGELLVGRAVAFWMGEEKEKQGRWDGMGGWMVGWPRGMCNGQRPTNRARKMSVLCSPMIQIWIKFKTEMGLHKHKTNIR